jgi:hypothetical protein
MTENFNVKDYAKICESVSHLFHTFWISVDDNRDMYDKIVDFIEKKENLTK